MINELIQAFKPIIRIQQVERQTDMFSNIGVRSNQYAYKNFITAKEGILSCMPSNFLKKLHSFLSEELLRTFRWFLDNRSNAYYWGEAHDASHLDALDNIENRDMRIIKAQLYSDAPLKLPLGGYLREILTQLDTVRPHSRSRYFSGYNLNFVLLKQFILGYNEELQKAQKMLDNKLKTNNLNAKTTKRVG